MRIYFATNRNPKPRKTPVTFGIHPDNLMGAYLRFGWADVDDHEHRKFKIKVAPERIEVGAKKAKVNDYSDQLLGSKTVFEAVRQEMKELRQDCLIYIHGFNVSFKDAIVSAAELKSLYKKPLTLFLFTWPSDGKLIPFVSYASDRDDAKTSGGALGRGILKLSDYLRGVDPKDFCGQGIHLIAHSMGNYALRHAIQYILSQKKASPRRIFDEVLSIAADEDHDAFECDYKLKQLPDMAKRVTIYHNLHDSILMISDYTKDNMDRLGAAGPRNSLLTPDKVVPVDCRSVVRFKNDKYGHHYFKTVKEVIFDIEQVLQGVDSQDIPGREYQPHNRGYRLQRSK